MERFLFLSLLAIGFFIYSLICYKKRKLIYTVNSLESLAIGRKFIVIDNKYFPLQLKMCILNSIALLIGAAICQAQESTAPIFIFILVYWVINILLKKLAIIKNYAKIKNE